MTLFQKLRAALRRRGPAAVPLRTAPIGRPRSAPIEINISHTREGYLMQPRNRYEVLCGREL
jgi:hypothetical protein